MVSADDTRRAAAKCDNCGAIFAARVLPDGTIRPIGQRESCSCDETSLRLLEGDGG